LGASLRGRARKRARSWGAVPMDIGQDAAPWVVLADPEGNEFCVLEARDEYLGIGPVAAVVVDALDPRSIAAFWSHATDLPVTREHPEYASVRQQSGFWLEFVRVNEYLQEYGRQQGLLGAHIRGATWCRLPVVP
jgi:Glyoxalase-like domain